MKLLYIRSIRLTAALPFLALLLTAPTFAQDRSVPDAFSADLIQKQIGYLASDELKGRGSGDPGNEKAAQFIAQEFARNGVRPLGTSRQRDASAPMDGSGYFQPFTFIAGREVGKGNHLESVAKGKTDAYRLGQDYYPSPISGAGVAAGNLVFVGYGIHAPDNEHDDYRGMDIKGKIVLALDGNPKNDPHSPLAEYAGVRRKSLTARELGAAALLIIPPKEEAAVRPSRFGASSQVADAGLPIFRISRAVADRWLNVEGAPYGGLAAWEQHADDDSMAFKLNLALFSLNRNIRLNADLKKVEKVTANVVGLIEGSDPTLKNEIVVVGAHLDHLGMGGPGSGSLDTSGKPAIHHGADDNASGTAGVMALSRYLGNAGSAVASTRRLTSDTSKSKIETRKSERPRRSILLICFSGEELGLYGSEHYVKHPILPLEKTVAMLNMDMIGRLRDNKLIVIGSGTAKEWDGLLNDVNQTAGFALTRNEEGFGASDQQSFYLKNIPVLFFFTGSHAEYHKPSDTADKINAPGEAKVIAMVADCLTRIADNSDRPTFQKINVPAPGGSTGFRVYFGSIPDYAAMVEGVQLNGVTANSPAAKAGLKTGDIIIKFGDTNIKSVQDYALALGNYKPGDVIDVVILRDGQQLTLKATLAARKE